jgi:hypothetical protein
MTGFRFRRIIITTAFSHVPSASIREKERTAVQFEFNGALRSISEYSFDSLSAITYYVFGG